MIKETSIATVLAAAVAGGGGYATLDRWVVPMIEENAEAAQIAQNKAEATNIVTQKLIEDRIKDLRVKLASTTDRAQQAELQHRISQYERKLEQLEAQLLK